MTSDIQNKEKRKKKKRKARRREQRRRRTERRRGERRTGPCGEGKKVEEGREGGRVGAWLGFLVRCSRKKRKTS